MVQKFSKIETLPRIKPNILFHIGCLFFGRRPDDDVEICVNGKCKIVKRYQV